MNEDQIKGRAGIISSMFIFGSIGIFVRQINLFSGQIALARALFGSLTLIMIIVWRSRSHRLNIKKALTRNLVILIISGAAIGFNWIFIFEAYRYTSIAVATLSYYFAPLFVVMFSPLVLKEKLSPLKVFLVLIALAGLFLILMSEVRLTGSTGISDILTDQSSSLLAGVGFGLLAAILYALVILINKKIKNLPGLEMTSVQLVTALIFMLPYVYLNEGFEKFAVLNSTGWLLLIILGVLHTGISYFVYFASFRFVPGQTIALLSYIDPVFAIIFAAVFLREIPGILQISGGILILGSTLISELTGRKS
jgi:drug/metabolite transporter (DMT)-like permease